jgi:hypothetical protein
MDGLKTGKLGGALGGCWITPALLQALFTFLHSEGTLYLFLSFFLQKSGGCTSRTCCFNWKKKPN